MGAVELAMFAMLWSAMLVMMLPQATFSQQSLLLLISCAAVASIGFAAAIMPAAAISSATVITLTCLLCVPFITPILVVAIVTLWVQIARGSLLTTRAMFARMRAQQDLGERNAVIQLLLKEFEANGSDWLLEVNETGHITHMSARFAEALGRPVDTIVGRHFLKVMGADQIGDAGVAELRTAFMARRPFRDLVVPAVIDGDMHWWSLSATPKLAADGSFLGLRGIARDISELRRGEERIARLARFDPLTGLANRSLFRETLEDVLQRPGNGPRRCALLFLDLDRFKQVNDTMGHGAGDKLLVQVAERMRALFDTGATLARLGGDEFAVILPGVTARTVASRADALVKALAQPFEIDSQHALIGGSVGWSMAPDNGSTAEALLKAADLALYEAKAAGRGMAKRYNDDMRSRAEARRVLEAALPGAIARGELSLEYQPIVDAGDERVVCFEALLRWHHPQLGKVTPDRFIPVAEDTGLIMEIGQWVINEACQQAATWPENVGVAVNVSPAQMDDPRLVEVVAAALARHGLAPHRLELEITERMFLEETPETVSRLAALNALGIRFVLDDFGTGYSSLGYLKKAVFSRIKIDRSFVSQASDGGEATAIIDAIVKLAGRLEMTTTAEGAETRAEFETCRDLGCARVQGYLFGRPMAAEAALQLARESAGQPVLIA
jgi:diguanylate cyclase (GGDEF)-like protein/PAS domain S-box-containing protein